MIRVDQELRSQPVGALCGPDARCPRTPLTRLDVELNALAPLEGIEVHGAVQPGAVKEVLHPILGGDEPEAPISDELLDGPLRHVQEGITPSSEMRCPFTLA